MRKKPQNVDADDNPDWAESEQHDRRFVFHDEGERNNHEIINGKRRKRIARGSGTNVQQVNQLLRQYVQTRKMMKTLSQGMLGKHLSKLRVPGLSA